MDIAQNIVAIGGLISDANSASLFTYALGLARRKNPSVGFVSTASGDSESFVSRFYETFRSFPCQSSHLPLFARTPDVAAYLAGLDVILVGGGNTLSMLAVWSAWGIPQELKRAWENGTVLVGWSAGAMCWFESGFSDAFAAQLSPIPCLGFLQGSYCPHYSDAERRVEFHNAISVGHVTAGWGVNSGAAIHFRGTEPAALLSPTIGDGAYHVSSSSKGCAVVSLAAAHVSVPAG